MSDVVGRSRAALRGAAASVVVSMARGYQVTLSPLLGWSCRYVPTCSNYLIEAVGKYGPWRGTAKGLWRVLRCNPFGGQGYDPA